MWLWNWQVPACRPCRAWGGVLGGLAGAAPQLVGRRRRRSRGKGAQCSRALPAAPAARQRWTDARFQPKLRAGDPPTRRHRPAAVAARRRLPPPAAANLSHPCSIACCRFQSVLNSLGLGELSASYVGLVWLCTAVAAAVAALCATVPPATPARLPANPCPVLRSASLPALPVLIVAHSQQECQDPVPWAGQCGQDDAHAHAEGRVSGRVLAAAGLCRVSRLEAHALLLPAACRTPLLRMPGPACADCCSSGPERHSAHPCNPPLCAAGGLRSISPRSTPLQRCAAASAAVCMTCSRLLRSAGLRLWCCSGCGVAVAAGTEHATGRLICPCRSCKWRASTSRRLTWAATKSRGGCGRTITPRCALAAPPLVPWLLRPTADYAFGRQVQKDSVCRAGHVLLPRLLVACTGPEPAAPASRASVCAGGCHCVPC